MVVVQLMIHLYQKINVMKVLSKLMDNPYTGFYLRETARDLDMSPMTVKRCLDLLLKDDLICKYAEKNNILFKVNMDNPVLTQMKIAYNLARIDDMGIIKKILDNNEGIVSITLYGSYATGTNDRKSDIDLLIVTSTRKAIEPRTFSDVAEEISVVQMRPDEWEGQSVKNRAFYQEVIRDGISLYGSRMVRS